MNIAQNQKILRVVLDTNVIVSALHFGGKPAKIILLAQRGIVELSLSDFILDETYAVLIKKFGWEAKRTREAMKLLGYISQIIIPLERLNIVEDEPDNRILECAVSSGAQYLISGDHHLLQLKKLRNITIVSPHTFLQACHLENLL